MRIQKQLQYESSFDVEQVLSHGLGFRIQVGGLPLLRCKHQWACNPDGLCPWQTRETQIKFPLYVGIVEVKVPFALIAIPGCADKIAVGWKEPA
jgi:hypothetical protein